MGVFVDGGSASRVDASALGGVTAAFPQPPTPAEDGYVVTYSDATGDLELQPTAGVIVISAANPQPLGVATPGITGEVSDAGHVHALPTAAEVGADPAGAAAAAVSALGLGAVTATGATEALARDEISVYSKTETDAAITMTVGGLLYKQPCRAVATTPVASLSGLPTIDGVTILPLDTNKRVLLTAQSDAKKNGPWVTATGAWLRPDPNELQACAAFPVEDGTVYHDTVWYLTTNDPIVPGVTDIALSQLNLNIPASQISDSTAAGRALLTAPTVADQRTDLGLGGAAVLNVGTGAGDVAAGNAPAAAAAAVTTTSIGAVPTSRTVNSKALSSNITLSAADVGADPAGSAAAVTTTSIGAVPTSRTVAGNALTADISTATLKTSLGIGAVLATGADQAAARSAIGLGDAATLSVGTTSNTVAAGTAPVAAVSARSFIVPLTGYATSTGPVTAVAWITFNPSLYAIDGKTTVLTLETTGSVSAAGLTGTVTLQNLTDSASAATLSVVATTPTAQSASVSLPVSTKIYELRLSVSGTGYVAAGAIIRITWI